jgi:Bacterial PH domain
MPYIDTVLEADEEVLCRPRYHWWWNLRSFGLLNAFNHILITDRRVLKKTGILAVSVDSMAYSQMESRDLDQSITGRLFGYGDLHIFGSGGKSFLFNHLRDPATVSREIGRAAALHRGLATLDDAEAAPDPRDHRRRPA